MESVPRGAGRPLSFWHKEGAPPSPYAFQWYGLLWPKDALEKNLAERCRRMIQQGLLEETESLLKQGVPPEAP